MAIDSFKINKSLSLNSQPSTISSPQDGDLYFHENKGISFYKDGFWHDLTDVLDFAASLSMTSVNLDDLSVRNNMVKFTGTLASAADLHGLTASANGKFVYIYNQTNQNIVLKHQSFTETTPTNRIVTSTGRDIKIKPNQAALVSYDATTSRWLVLSVGGGGGEIEVPFILGENLTEGTPVYVSQGAADGGRNAGEIYTLDNTDDNRMEYIGVMAESGTTGQEKVVKIIGVVEGLSGLTPGLPVYWDAGVYTQTEPSTPGTWQITVGKAISATEMLINPDLASSALFIETTSGALTVNNNQTSPFPVATLMVDGTTYKSFTAEYWVDRSTLSIDGIDTSFSTNTGTGFNNTTTRVGVQSDGKAIVGGNFFTTFDAASRIRIARLNPDGTEDSSFYTNLTAGPNSEISSITVQPDDKVLVGGFFTLIGGNTRNRLVRLNSDGTEDVAFYTNLGTAFNAAVYLSTVQSDGKILVGGAFTTFNGNTRNRLVRLNADGTEDTAFYTNLGTAFGGGSPRACTILSDDSIVISGDFTSFNGSSANRMVKLNSDGTWVSSFNTNIGTGPGISTAVAAQSDDKIIVGFYDTTFNGNTRNRLVRLNSDGTEDVAFYTNLGTAFNNLIDEVIVLPDDKIVAVGQFTTFDGATANRVIRLNADGTEDTAFNTSLGTAFNDRALDVDYNELTGDLYFAGIFTTIDSQTSNRIAKINTAQAEQKTEAGVIRGIYSSQTTSWQIATGGVAGSADIAFQIDNTGQVTYTTDNMTGSNYVGQMKFEFSSLIED